MKITVSYISSIYDTKKTIFLINNTSADALHVDLMDGNYVGSKNFDIDTLPDLLSVSSKPLDIHMMVDNPSKYLDKLYLLKPECIYIHPSTCQDIKGVLDNITNHNITPGIVINPDESIKDFIKYFPFVKRILLMSVYPGKGGQKFILSTSQKLDELITYKKDYSFKIYIDGGINDETISKVSKADGIIAGSYICQEFDFEKQITKLKYYDK